MSLIVQKFGGTSVATPEKILAAARKAIRAQQAGNQVVVVVSAMGHNTDQLIELADQITESPPAREMDMLLSTGEQISVALMAMAVHSLGHKAISLTGAQIGIMTDSTHTKARIRSISTERIRRLLDEGHVVIAAGFQGIDENFNVTTLGRGGSDTTAVALAAVLNASLCEIFTDVDGVYTTDPRIVPEARKVERISYDEMLELASLGAGVMHNRSIEFAKKFDVAVHVRNSQSDGAGTVIAAAPESSSQSVCGAALVKDEARITVLGLPDRPGSIHAIFAAVAASHITVDMIVQNVAEGGGTDVSFTVAKNELTNAMKAVEKAVAAVGAAGLSYDDHVSKVSIVGLGMSKQTGVAERMFKALADVGINMQMITTSEIKVSALVDKDQGVEALRTVHKAFGLEQTPSGPGSVTVAQKDSASRGIEIISRLQSMEALAVDQIELDESQGRITLRGIPDVAGIAAKLFHEIAQSGVFVDMIVQSMPVTGSASLTFTVPLEQLELAERTAGRVAAGFEGKIEASRDIAKLSVSGIGMRSNADAVVRLFDALASGGHNVEMVNTSEVRINVVVGRSSGRAAMTALQKQFADALA